MHGYSIGNRTLANVCVVLIFPLHSSARFMFHLIRRHYRKHRISMSNFRVLSWWQKFTLGKVYHLKWLLGRLPLSAITICNPKFIVIISRISWFHYHLLLSLYNFGSLFTTKRNTCNIAAFGSRPNPAGASWIPRKNMSSIYLHLTWR